MLFDQFGEIPSDELPERAVVEPEPPGQRLHAFGCRAVQVHGLAVFLHAAAGHRAARIRPDHSLPGIQFRLVFLQVAAERSFSRRMASAYLAFVAGLYFRTLDQSTSRPSS